ncbi:Ubiquitin carboxyl-terminal hydrolase 34, partial [Xenotaenia resolanae]
MASCVRCLAKGNPSSLFQIRVLASVAGHHAESCRAALKLGRYCSGCVCLSGLSLEQVDILWHCLVEDAECYDDALHWFLNQVRSKDQHAMGMETYKHLFLEKMPQLKPETISMTGLNLFQHLCNLARLATSTLDNASSCELCGMDQLWGIALRAQSADISRAAIQYINSYYINAGKTGLEKEQEFIRKCIESLLMASANLEKEAHSSLTSTERGLLMLKTHLEAFRR